MEPISRKTCKLPTCKGGLNIMDINERCENYRILQFKEYMEPTPYPWKVLYAHFYGIPFRHLSPGIYKMSHTHTIMRNSQQTKIINTIRHFCEENSNVNWAKITLKSLSEIKRKHTKFKPSVELNEYNILWEEIYYELGQFKRYIPFFVQETNFKCLHRIFLTKDVLMNKYRLTTDSKCRLCENENETLEHILTSCTITSLLKQNVVGKVKTEDINSSIILRKPAETKEDFILLSFYRFTITKLWTKVVKENMKYVEAFQKELNKYKL